MNKVYNLNDEDLPEDLFIIRNIFLTKDKNESLHDYFIRKNITCFCPKCRKKTESIEKAKQITLTF